MKQRRKEREKEKEDCVTKNKDYIPYIHIYIYLCEIAISLDIHTYVIYKYIWQHNIDQMCNLIAQLGENRVSRRLNVSYRNTFKKQLRHGPSICIDARTIHVNVIRNLL